MYPNVASEKQDDSMMNTQSFIILKWTGCSPSTNIGTLFVTTAVSV